MKLDAHIDSILGDLAQVAAVGDEAAANVARQMTSALQNSIRLRILAAMSEAAVEISSQLPHGHVNVRLDGQDPSLVYSGDPLGPASGTDDDSSTARISLRLPDSLKSAVESAAAREGLSVNAWLTRTISAAVDTNRGGRDSGFRGPGSRLRGFSKA